MAVDVSRMHLDEAQAQLHLAEGFDIGLEMSGRASALREMIDNMTHGGRIALLGLPAEEIAVDWGKVVTHMLTLKGIYGREMFETWYAMSAMLQSNRQLHEAVSGVITDVLPASDWAAGFETAREGTGGKVVLDWTRI
jgi:threonine 3-dehydrogenase